MNIKHDHRVLHYNSFGGKCDSLNVKTMQDALNLIDDYDLDVVFGPYVMTDYVYLQIKV